MVCLEQGYSFILCWNWLQRLQEPLAQAPLSSIIFRFTCEEIIFSYMRTVSLALGTSVWLYNSIQMATVTTVAIEEDKQVRYCQNISVETLQNRIDGNILTDDSSNLPVRAPLEGHS